MTRRPPAEEPRLFDLPLEPAAAEAPPPPKKQPALPLAPTEAPEPDPAGEPAAPRMGSERPRRRSRPAGLRPRLLAGLVDLGFCASVLAILLVFLWSTGTVPTTGDLPAAILFLLAFSFLYQVLPLAFWGRTLGMSLAGLRAATPGGEPLTFRQTILRWLGGVVTVALAGLPLLLIPTGRSLTDRMSGSLTRTFPHAR